LQWRVVEFQIIKLSQPMRVPWAAIQLQKLPGVVASYLALTHTVVKRVLAVQRAAEVLTGGLQGKKLCRLGFWLAGHGCGSEPRCRLRMWIK
jgi:hypothetical protein